jgi:hypothetical protein
MPYFLGIYLLQGSLILLLAVDRFKSDTSESVKVSLMSFIRSTEACVLAMGFPYQVRAFLYFFANSVVDYLQRQYRYILASALAQARGHFVPEKDALARREATLNMYRWTFNGTGLAVFAS